MLDMDDPVPHPLYHTQQRGIPLARGPGAYDGEHAQSHGTGSPPVVPSPQYRMQLSQASVPGMSLAGGQDCNDVDVHL